MKLPTVGTEKCPCTERCSTYFLTGVGRFVQGSGFDQDVAEEIAMRLNAHDDLVAAAKAILEARRKGELHYAEVEFGRLRRALAKAGEK